MTPEQMKDEIKGVVKLFDEVYSTFGLKYEIELSTMPEDHIGTVEQWEHNQEILKGSHHGDGQELHHQRGRRRVLRPEAGLPTSLTASAAPGSAAPSSWTASCPSALSSSMWARTAPSTAP